MNDHVKGSEYRIVALHSLFSPAVCCQGSSAVMRGQLADKISGDIGRYSDSAARESAIKVSLHRDVSPH